MISFFFSNAILRNAHKKNTLIEKTHCVLLKPPESGAKAQGTKIKCFSNTNQCYLYLLLNICKRYSSIRWFGFVTRAVSVIQPVSQYSTSSWEHVALSGLRPSAAPSDQTAGKNFKVG